MSRPRRWTRTLPVLIGLAGLLAPAFSAPLADVHIAFDADGATPNVSVSDNAYVGPDETHEGDIVNIFGDVNIDGRVTGNVVVILGKLRVAGTIEGDVVSILSRARLEEGAAIEGEMVNIGGPMSRGSGSRVSGEMVNINVGDFVPFLAEAGASALVRLWLIIRLASLALLFLVTVLMTALVPRRLSVMADAFPARWGWALLTGLAAYGAFAVGFVILFLTILGIPLALALWLCMLITKWMGLASIFLLIGRTAGRNLFGREVAHLPAALGGFAVYAVLSLVPFFGFAFGLGMNILAIGTTLVSRYGSEEPWRRGPAGPGVYPGPVTPVPPAPAPPPIYGS